MTPCRTDRCQREGTRQDGHEIIGDEVVPVYYCPDCWGARMARRLASDSYRTTSLDGVIAPRALVGQRPDGTVAPGAVNWHWRPPRLEPDDHHEQAIVLGTPGASGAIVCGAVPPTLHFQQAAPVHVRGARIDSAPAVATRIREISEAEAARLLLVTTASGLDEDALAAGLSGRERRKLFGARKRKFLRG